MLHSLVLALQRRQTMAITYHNDSGTGDVFRIRLFLHGKHFVQNETYNGFARFPSCIPPLRPLLTLKISHLPEELIFIGHSPLPLRRSRWRRKNLRIGANKQKACDFIRFGTGGRPISSPACPPMPPTAGPPRRRSTLISTSKPRCSPRNNGLRRRRPLDALLHSMSWRRPETGIRRSIRSQRKHPDENNYGDRLRSSPAGSSSRTLMPRRRQYLHGEKV